MQIYRNNTKIQTGLRERTLETVTFFLEQGQALYLVECAHVISRWGRVDQSAQSPFVDVQQRNVGAGPLWNQRDQECLLQVMYGSVTEVFERDGFGGPCLRLPDTSATHFKRFCLHRARRSSSTQLCSGLVREIDEMKQGSHK